MSSQHISNGSGNGKHALSGYTVLNSRNASELREDWKTHPRWQGVKRPYTAEDVIRLRGSIPIEYTLARLGAERLWYLLHTEPHVAALGALTGNQAVQQVKAGLKAIYLSGWQVAADANLSGQMYPDQSLYPANSYWFAPIVADAEAGFGGPLNVFELMKSMIDAGAAGVHFEDQLSSEKKCGHMGGKVLIPTQSAIKHLVSARLATDVMGVPTLVVARTDANGAHLITSDIDPVDHKFLTRERTPEGFYRLHGGIKAAIARGLSYAPYCDLIWCETSTPNLKEAQHFADEIHAHYPGKMLAYNCSPSFNWRKKLDANTIAVFQKELAKMGYKFQFITLAGFHALNYSMFNLALGYRDHGMTAYSELQEAEFALEQYGYTATKHQREVGTGYFDEVAQIVAGGMSSTTALAGSTEVEQFV